MNWAIVVICFIATYINTGYCGEDCKTRAQDPDSDKTRLKKSLLCGYDSTVRLPDSNGGRTKVNLFLGLSHIILDEDYNTIGVYYGLGMVWKDERLKWNPSHFGNLVHIHLDSNYIWIPPIGLVTMNTVSDRLYSPNIPCIVYSTGKVNCLSWSSFHTICKSDLTHWPYDSHVCDALLAPWRLAEEEIELISANNDEVILDMYQPNREWALLQAKMKKRHENYENSTFEYLEIAFSLARHSATYEAIVVTPALVLMMLTLASSWIEAQTSTRLNVVFSLIVCHVWYLQYASLMLSDNGDSCPLIILFYRDSFKVCGSSLIVALLVRWVTSFKTCPPNWVSNMTNKVQQSRSGQLLLFLQQPQRIAETGEVETLPQIGGSGWDIVGKLLDRIAFLIFCVVYFLILIVYYLYYV